jgi:hypothetical protein
MSDLASSFWADVGQQATPTPPLRLSGVLGEIRHSFAAAIYRQALTGLC